MKLSEIKKKFEKAKKLLNEISMLEALLRSMEKSRKAHPEELPYDETYYNNVVKRLENDKEELNNIFK